MSKKTSYETMAPTSTVFNKTFLTLKSVGLGRLVTNAADPGQDFWPTSTPALDEASVDELPYNAVREVIGRHRFASIRAKLSQLFAAESATERTAHSELEAPELKRYSLLNHSAYFERICKDDAARQWMEKMLRYCPLFLVVELITVKEASVAQGYREGDRAGFTVTVPVADIVTSGASTAAGVDGNVGVQAEAGRRTHGSASYFVPGERVIGVNYRKLRFGLLSGKNADSAYLEQGNRWRMFYGSRGDDDDILEAGFEDSLNGEELELEEEYEDIAEDDEQFVFIK